MIKGKVILHKVNFLLKLLKKIYILGVGSHRNCQNYIISIPNTQFLFYEKCICFSHEQLIQGGKKNQFDSLLKIKQSRGDLQREYVTVF